MENISNQMFLLANSFHVSSDATSDILVVFFFLQMVAVKREIIIWNV